VKDIASYVNRGVAPVYADGETGALAFNQKCVRPDLTIAPELGQSVVDGSWVADSPALLRAGDVVVNSTGRGTLGRAAILRSEPVDPLIADGHVTIIRVREGVADADFVAYLLGTPAFYEQANACLAVGATNQTELNREPLRRMRISLPPVEDQIRIAAALDVELAALDALVAEQESFKALLGERLAASRQVLLLGPEGRGTPDSEHGRLKRFVHVARGRFSHRPRNDPALYDGPYPFIQTGDIAGASSGVVETWSQTLNERGLAASRLAPAGTLVMAIAANIGDVALLGFDACFPDSVVAVSPRAGLSAEYLLELLRALRQEFIGSSTLNTQLNINVDRTGDVVVHIPPAAEQRRTLAELTRLASDLATAATEVDHQVRLLLEHRQALITAAVSGGLDALQGVA